MRKNKFYIFVCFIIGSFLLSSCLKDDEYTPVPVAGLTMVNGYTGDQGVIYYIGHRAVEPLMYKTFSGVNVVEGNRNIMVRGLNSSNPLIDTTVAVLDSTYYTSFVFGTSEVPKHFITEDKAVDLSTNQVGIRFFNVGEVNGNVSLQIGDQEAKPSFQNRPVDNQASATEHQEFLSQGSGTFTLTVKDASGNVLATRESVKMDAGRYYTLILLGRPNDDSTPFYIGVIEQAVN